MVNFRRPIAILGEPANARIVVIILVFLSTLLLNQLGVLEFLELRAYDQLLSFRSPKAAPSRVTIINISEADIQRLSRWPVSDADLAEALARLARFQPGAIGVDIYRDLPVPPGHSQLGKVLIQSENIVAAMKFGVQDSADVPPPPALKNAARHGFTDVFLDPDGIVRRGLLFLDDGKTVTSSLALRLSQIYLREKGITPTPDPSNPRHIRLGSTTLQPLEANDGGYVGADARGYQFPLDFCKRLNVIPRYTLTQFNSGKVLSTDFKDRVVLIGVSAESVKDFFLTSCVGGMGKDQRISGVLLHAAMVDQLLRTGLDGDKPLQTVNDFEEFLWILFWCVAGGLSSQLLSSHLQFAFAQIGGLGLLGLIATLSFVQGTWLIVAAPALAWLVSGTVATAYKASREKQERTLLMNLFSKHVAPEIAQEIWQKRDQFFADGRPLPQKTIATIMFTDIQAFTNLAEGMDPPALFDWLNEYLTGMTPLVTASGGVVIRFIGDAILAGFGIPVPSNLEEEIRQDAVNAIRCALSMEEKLIELNARWRKQGLPTVGMRIGLFTGSLVTGSLGDRERMEYTVHGDAVNTAARLESFDKSQFIPDPCTRPCRILIGESTLNYLGKQFVTEPVGKVPLRGKNQPISVFRILGWRRCASSQ